MQPYCGDAIWVRTGVMAGESSRPRLSEAPVLEGLLDAVPGDLEAAGASDALRVAGDVARGRDLRGARFLEVLWDAAELEGADFAGARFVENRFQDLSCTSFPATSSQWRDVEVIGSRFGAVALDRADLQSVRWANAKIGYLNLRYAAGRDMVFTDCQIEECDLAFAGLRRVQLQRCRIGRLTLSSAVLEDVDLRGADIERIAGIEGLAGSIVTEVQLWDLAPALAEHLGITVEPAPPEGGA